MAAPHTSKRAPPRCRIDMGPSSLGLSVAATEHAPQPPPTKAIHPTLRGYPRPPPCRPRGVGAERARDAAKTSDLPAYRIRHLGPTTIAARRRQFPPALLPGATGEGRGFVTLTE